MSFPAATAAAAATARKSRCSSRAACLSEYAPCLSNRARRGHGIPFFLNNSTNMFKYLRFRKRQAFFTDVKQCRGVKNTCKKRTGAKYSSLHDTPKMTTGMKWVLRSLAGLVLIVLLVCGAFYLVFIHPGRQLAQWAMTGYRDVPAERVRHLAHRMISLPWGNHHDAFVALGEVGNAESIPYLIRALKWQEPPDTNGIVVCTTAHCSRRLLGLTGMWFRSDYEKWKQWWDETGCHMTPDQLAGQARAAREQAKEAANNTSDGVRSKTP